MNCWPTSIKALCDKEQGANACGVKGKGNCIVVAVVGVGVECSSAADIMKERIRQGGDIGDFTEHPR